MLCEQKPPQTKKNTKNVWLRRKVTIDCSSPADLQGQAKLSDSPGSNDAASTSSEGDMDPQRLSCQTLAVRCLICLKVFCSDSTLQNELKGVLLGTAPFVGKACSRLKKIADAREFLHVSSTHGVIVFDLFGQEAPRLAAPG